MAIFLTLALTSGGLGRVILSTPPLNAALIFAGSASKGSVIERLKLEGVPYISVMTDPTMGGVSASLALLGDINAAEPKALIGFAGPRVIEQTVGETLPEGFQRAEFLLDKGALDFIVDRRRAREDIAALLAKMLDRPLSA